MNLENGSETSEKVCVEMEVPETEGNLKEEIRRLLTRNKQLETELKVQEANVAFIKQQQHECRQECAKTLETLTETLRSTVKEQAEYFLRQINHLGKIAGFGYLFTEQDVLLDKVVTFEDAILILRMLGGLIRPLVSESQQTGRIKVLDQVQLAFEKSEKKLFKLISKWHPKEDKLAQGKSLLYIQKLVRECEPKILWYSSQVKVSATSCQHNMIISELQGEVDKLRQMNAEATERRRLETRERDQLQTELLHLTEKCKQQDSAYNSQTNDLKQEIDQLWTEIEAHKSDVDQPNCRVKQLETERLRDHEHHSQRIGQTKTIDEAQLRNLIGNLEIECWAEAVMEKARKLTEIVEPLRQLLKHGDKEGASGQQKTLVDPIDTTTTTNTMAVTHREGQDPVDELDCASSRTDPGISKTNEEPSNGLDHDEQRH